MSLCIILIIIYLFLFILWKRRYVYILWWKLKSDYISFPLIGHVYMFIGNDEDRMKGFQKVGENAIKYGGLSTMWLGPRLFVVVVEPMDIGRVMISSLAKDDVMYVTHDVQGNGSIFAPVSIWRSRRKAIAPAFNMKNLNKFVSVFDKQSNKLADRLKQEAGRGTFSIFRYFTTYTMDSVCENTLNINTRNKNTGLFIDSFQRCCEILSFRLCLPPSVQYIHRHLFKNKQFMKFVQTMHSFVDQIINEKRIEMKEKHLENSEHIEENKQKPFLEMYIETGFNDLELREETLVLIAAGTDTLAVASSFTCLMLSMHHDVQEKAYRELQEVFGNSDRPVTAEDLPKLKYLEMVIKESLRLYPPVPVIVRKVDKPIQLENGLILPKDTSILINIWSTHRNPRHWGEDAEVFRPERFLDSPLEHPNAFIPFSGGPRSCIGYKYALMSLKTVMSTILRRYKILPSNPREKHTVLRVKFGLMMKDVNDFQVKLETRK